MKQIIIVHKLIQILSQMGPIVRLNSYVEGSVGSSYPHSTRLPTDNLTYKIISIVYRIISTHKQDHFYYYSHIIIIVVLTPLAETTNCDQFMTLLKVIATKWGFPSSYY